VEPAKIGSAPKTGYTLCLLECTNEMSVSVVWHKLFENGGSEISVEAKIYQIKERWILPGCAKRLNWHECLQPLCSFGHGFYNGCEMTDLWE